MKKEDFLKDIMELPKVETNNPISAMNSINVDDLMNAIDRLNKVPTFDELLRENKKQKEVIIKAINFIKNAQYDAELQNHVYGLNFSGVKRLLDILKEVSE